MQQEQPEPAVSGTAAIRTSTGSFLMLLIAVTSISGTNALLLSKKHLMNSSAKVYRISQVVSMLSIHTEELESELEGDINLSGFLGLSDDVPKGFTEIRIKFRVKADVDNMERLKRLTAYSPVFNTMTQGANVEIQVEPK